MKKIFNFVKNTCLFSSLAVLVLTVTCYCQTTAYGDVSEISEGSVPVTKFKVSAQPKVKKSSIVERKPKKYICYYEERIDGELVDDFKEWCTAYSKDEAREYFKDNYRHNPNVQISMIVEE